MLTQANAGDSKGQVESKYLVQADSLHGVATCIAVCIGGCHAELVSHPHNLPEIAIYNSDGASETCQQQQGCSSSGVGAPFAYKELFLWLQQKHTASLM